MSTLLFLALASLASVGSLAATTDESKSRQISADLFNEKGPRNMMWQDCVGADHPGILLRKANMEHLRMTKRDLGFKYIRFHGIFLDDMHAYQEVGGKPVYDFTAINKVYRAILKTGMKPFVEIGFMPEALATGDKRIFFWQANGSPPKDHQKWAEFITAFVVNLEKTFGKKEVESWRFEVWNEPNLDGFWTKGDQPSYFKLYDYTVRAIKGVNPKLLVGGPATAGCGWITETIEHADKERVALDFITTHTYGVDAGYFDEKGEGDNKLSPNPGAIIDDVKRVRGQIQSSTRPGLPLYFTEWSTSYNPRDPVHDAYISAPYILDKLKNTEGFVESMSYWVYTDLFEEAGPTPSSFHGGFGLINREGIPKASFFAYKYLNMLGSTELRNSDARSILTKTENGFKGLVWDYTTPDQHESNRPYFRKVHPAKATAPIELKLNGLEPGTYQFSVRRTGYKANDAYTTYMEWGLPKDLNPDQIRQLKKQTSDKPEIRKTVTIAADGKFSASISLRENDLLYIDLTKV